MEFEMIIETIGYLLVCLGVAILIFLWANNNWSTEETWEKL